MILQTNIKKFGLELGQITNGGKELFYEKKRAKIGINTDDDLPLNKSLKLPTLVIIIRCVFQEDKKFYPLIYLDECLYKL